MENILKQKGMLCNVKQINVQIVIERKKTVIHYIYIYIFQLHLILFAVYCL